RKSDTTLGITSFHYEVRAFPGAASDQLDLPASAADARDRQRLGRQRRHPPARHRRRRLSEIGGLGLTPPPPDRDADRAGGFRRELQPPRRRHRQPRDF